MADIHCRNSNKCLGYSLIRSIISFCVNILAFFLLLARTKVFVFNLKENFLCLSVEPYCRTNMTTNEVLMQTKQKNVSVRLYNIQLSIIHCKFSRCERPRAKNSIFNKTILLRQLWQPHSLSSPIIQSLCAHAYTI